MMRAAEQTGCLDAGDGKRLRHASLSLELAAPAGTAPETAQYCAGASPPEPAEKPATARGLELSDRPNPKE